MVRVRYAPSPTGMPHVGNIRTALFNWVFARGSGGKFIVRIEDTDRNRYVPGSEEDILASIQWLGLDYDEGPIVGGPFAPYHQSERTHIYQEIAHRLVDEGKAYKCFCTPEILDAMRKEQEARKQPTGYDRRCRRLSKDEVKAHEGDPYVVRFAMPLEGVTQYNDGIHGLIEFRNILVDDFVMLKSDGYPTYHLANVVDDHLMEITHVIRGDEWISSMPRHVQLYAALGWEPPKLNHVPLLMGPDGSKLSKRHGAVQFSDFIQQGYLSDAMFNFLALCGWSPGDEREIMSREEIIRDFSLDRISTNPFVFHHDKLKWMNGQYIKRLPIDEFVEAAVPFLRKAGIVAEENLDYARKVIPLEQEKVKLLSELPELLSFFFTDRIAMDEAAAKKWQGMPHIGQMLDALIRSYTDLERFEPEEIERVTRDTIAWLGVPNGHVIHPVRLALSGRTTGPGLFEMIAALGKERTVARLEQAKRSLL
ncbi:MAG: glutamate--tRNA ligase [Armatimonadetes bacterium]|nr:glutamate--tRNA ligase [Armatimonadota bacterium]